jgi:hypothetical protein
MNFIDANIFETTWNNYYENKLRYDIIHIYILLWLIYYKCVFELDRRTKIGMIFYHIFINDLDFIRRNIIPVIQ